MGGVHHLHMMPLQHQPYYFLPIQPHPFITPSPAHLYLRPLLNLQLGLPTEQKASLLYQEHTEAFPFLACFMFGFVPALHFNNIVIRLSLSGVCFDSCFQTWYRGVQPHLPWHWCWCLFWLHWVLEWHWGNSLITTLSGRELWQGTYHYCLLGKLISSTLFPLTFLYSSYPPSLSEVLTVPLPHTTRGDYLSKACLYHKQHFLKNRRGRLCVKREPQIFLWKQELSIVWC